MRFLKGSGPVAIAAVVASLAIGAGAFAAFGDLIPQGCISDVGDPAGCGATAEGLLEASGVAVSPDGASVYAVSELDDAIVRFDRGPGGSLTPQGCVSDVGDPAGCGPTAQGLDEASGVGVSPDGASVYAVSQTDNAIVRFDRAPGGALSAPSCIEDPPGDAGCGTTAPGLGSPSSVAVTPDGASVYVASQGDDAIVRFDRAPSGELSAPSCIEDIERDGQCDDVGAAGEAQGLNGASGVAVSPDGASVYAASQGDDAIVRFDRAPGGALSAPGCIEDPPSDAGCGATAQGLNGARGVAASPDGASVYAASQLDDAIVRFDRAPGGALSAPSCIEDPGAPTAGCEDTADGLNSAQAVAVSPDGASAYAVSQGDTIVLLDRAAGGTLSNPGCIEDPPGDEGCAATAQGLGTAQDLAVSPDAASVYAVSFDDAIVRFDRDLTVSPDADADDTDPPETLIVRGPKKKTKKRKAKFEFASDEPDSTFECKLDRKDFAPCDASEKFKVKRRKHKLQVAAVDPAGNVDPTPALRKWKVKKKKKK
jgi:DNA-binding beta-propeller fold protein YncE